MPDALIVDAVRSPIGKRNGVARFLDASGFHRLAGFVRDRPRDLIVSPE